MSDIHQISVFLENRAGTLSEVTRALASDGVNLRAISIAESEDYGVLRLIASDLEKATASLIKNGLVFSVTPVTVVSVPDEPSGLSRLLELLAQNQIDIQYLYSLFTHQNGRAYMVFRLEDEAPLLALLSQNGLSPATAKELDLK